MEELLGDYVVVDTLDEACSRAGACDEHARYVALDGTVFVPGAKLVVRNGFSNDSGVLPASVSLKVCVRLWPRPIELSLTPSPASSEAPRSSSANVP